MEGAYHMKNASQSHWGYPMCWSPENVSPVTSGILWSFPGRLVFCDLCCNSPQALDGPGNDVLTGQRQVWSHCNGIELGEEPNPVSCSPRKDDVSFEFCFKSSGTLGHAAFLRPSHFPCQTIWHWDPTSCLTAEVPAPTRAQLGWRDRNCFSWDLDLRSELIEWLTSDPESDCNWEIDD